MVRWLPGGFEEKTPARIWAGGVYREIRSRMWRQDAPELRFVIVAKGRTGSTLLTTSLDSHSGLTCADEILNRPQVDAIRYASRYAGRMSSPGFGFHVKPGQATRVQGFADLTAFADDMATAGWKIVHLQRRDVVAQYVSVLRGLQSKEWHRPSRRAGTSPPPIRVDVEAFLREIRKRQSGLLQERTALAPFDPFQLTYEDHLRRPDDRALRLEELQLWLGVPVEPLRSPLRKIVDRDPLDLLENGGDIRAALRSEGLTA